MGSCCDLDLFFVRHSVTKWNKERKYLGHTDQGIIKDELLQVKRLKEELGSFDFNRIFTSDLRRCKETVGYLNLSSRAKEDARLREINFGDWEGKTYNQLKGDERYQNWLTNWELHSIPNGESSEQFKSRLDSFMEERVQELLDQPGSLQQRILVVTHGGVIRYLVSKYTSNLSFWEVTVNHGHAIRLSLTRQKGEWLCNSLSEVPSREKEI